MSSEQPLTNRVRTCRIARGWSQDDLAARAGISRTGVSSIEINRLVPSTCTALPLPAASNAESRIYFNSVRRVLVKRLGRGSPTVNRAGIGGHQLPDAN